MKTLLIIVISSLLFGFTQQYYTDKNTDIIKAKDGTTTIIDKNGESIDGIYFIKSDEFGSFSIAPCIKGKINGVQKHFSSNVNVYFETGFKNGKEEGTQKFYHLLDNKTFNNTNYIRSDNFSDIMNGVEQMTRYIKENSYLGATVEYKHGKKDGKSKSYYYDNLTSLVKITPYSDGVVNGIEKDFLEDSENFIYTETNYIDGKRSGIKKHF